MDALEVANAGELEAPLWGRFAALGWTMADWDNLDDVETWPRGLQTKHRYVRFWLRSPPEFTTVITPGRVRELLARFPSSAHAALNAASVGASDRFMASFFAMHKSGNAATPWRATQALGLPDPVAAGWAATDLLDLGGDRAGVPGSPQVLLNRLTGWVEHVGPTGYLYFLAGFTLDEAAAVAGGGGPLTEQQLRVMVALNGVVLPARI